MEKMHMISLFIFIIYFYLFLICLALGAKIGRMTVIFSKDIEDCSIVLFLNNYIEVIIFIFVP